MSYNKIIFLMDITGSMGQFIPSLIPSVLQTSVISQLINKNNVKISIILYSDYDMESREIPNQDVIEKILPTTNIKNLVKFLEDHPHVYGGGGVAEAFKTGMIDVVNYSDKDTIVLHYTDAYPHCEHNPDREGCKEKLAISDTYWHWDSLVALFKSTNAKFITFHTRPVFEMSRCFQDLGMYNVVPNNTNSIVKDTVDTLLKFMPFNRDMVDKLFKDDDNYKNKCLCMFKEYILTDKCIDALQTNELFIYLWRMLNKFYKRDKLIDLLNSMSSLTNGREWLSNMIQESYIDVEGVLKILGEAPTQFPAFYYTGPKKSLKDVLSMARMGDPESFNDILQNYKVVTSGIFGEYIPLSLSYDKFLSVLSHLLCKGILFTNKRSKWLFSGMIVSGCSEDNPLFNIAETFLKKTTGLNIIDIEQKNGVYNEPLNISPFLPSLILNMPECYVSNNLRQFYRQIRNSINISQVLHASVEIEHSKVLYQHPIIGDTKVCNTCNQERHESLVVNGKCGLCISYEPEGITANNIKGNSTSYMYGCSECGENYQIVRRNLLYGKPKCYQCNVEKTRKRSSNYKTCSVCCNKFKTYDMVDKSVVWTCYSCNQNDKLIETNEFDVHTLIKNNSSILSKKLPDNVKCLKYSDKLSVFEGVKWITPSNITLGNTTTVITQPDVVIDRIKSLEGETDHCGICFDDFTHNQLTTICGNSSCKTKSCRKCLGKLYNSNQPGCIFNADLCPYCRQIPVLKVIKSVNKDLFKLLNTEDITCLDSKMYHFWCNRCNHVKPYIQRECAVDAPVLEGQVCVDCSTSVVEYQSDLNCPVCEIPVEHVDGCNHLTCRCGCHFCAICLGEWPDSISIYNHYDDGECPMYGSQ